MLSKNVKVENKEKYNLYIYMQYIFKNYNILFISHTLIFKYKIN